MVGSGKAILSKKNTTKMLQFETSSVFVSFTWATNVINEKTTWNNEIYLNEL